MDIVITCGDCGRQLDAEVSLLRGTQVGLEVEVCPDCLKEAAEAAGVSDG